MSRKTKRKKKSNSARQKRHIEPIPDTPENVAKALFGIKANRQKQSNKNS